MTFKLFMDMLYGLPGLARNVSSSFKSTLDLRLENVALRQQNELLIAQLNRQGKRVLSTPTDRLFWSLLSRFWKGWRQAIQVVQPETVVRWHKDLFKDFWKRKSKPKSKPKKRGRPPTKQEVIQLIHQMHAENPEWGQDRIADELTLKLGFHISERTVKKYMRIQPSPSPGMKWGTFMAEQAKGIFTCDFFTQHTAKFEVLHVFVIMHLETRRIVHFAVTRHPTLDFTKQCIREAVGWDELPKFLVHDNDQRYGQYHERKKTDEGTFRCHLDKWLKEIMRIEGVPIPYGAPKAQAHIERFIKTLRVELLDRFIFWNEAHLYRALREYIENYYNPVRPHQGIKGIPAPDPSIAITRDGQGKIVSHPIMSGLFHDYRRLAA